MPALIELKLAELAQLFNSMDPSPFHERDLDHDAEEFIVSWAREHARGDDLQLVVHLPQPSAEAQQSQPLVQESVRHYFKYRSDMLWREFRQLMKEGRITLLIGLGFMAACEFTALVVLQGESPWKAVIREGLTILGWVAMWRPLEIYLYRWWPLLSRRHLYDRLASMTVAVKITP